MIRPFRNQLRALFGVGFGFSAHLALTSYVNSSFLTAGKGIPAELIGLLFTLGSLIAIVELTYASRWYERMGNKGLLSGLILLHIAALTGVLLSPDPFIVSLFFVIYLAANSLIYYTIDLNVEHNIREEDTGNTRGVYLTISNAAWVAFPFIAGLILGRSLETTNFIPVYFISILALLGLLVYVNLAISSYQVPKQQHRPFLRTLEKFWHIKALRKIAISHFILQFFYAIMVIYTPIYLITEIGLGWEMLAFVFLIMLLPFVLFQIPLGKLADRKLGEKEILITGFIIMTLATASIAFVTTSAWWIWAGLLFLTRTGASAVEVMSESYFYKNVTEKEADFIGMFRDARPLGYLLGPLVATLLLAPNIFGLPLTYLFLALAAVLILGILNAITLEDTK